MPAGQSTEAGQFSENHWITSSKVRAVKLFVGSAIRWKKQLSFRHRRETEDSAMSVAEP